MLKHRIITAIILIPIVLALLFFLPTQLFCILAALIVLGGAWEWSNLMELKSRSSRVLYLLLIVLTFIIAALLIPVQAILFMGFLWWLCATALILLYPRCSEWWGKNLVLRGLMGMFVLVPCWGALCYIRSQNDGIYALLFLFILIWGADTAAYFAGKKFGKKKLLPLVSPGKSVEGVLGAIVFTTLITIIALWMCAVPFLIWPWAILLSLITVIFSIIGDLTESMLKRQAGLKDSGNLLPGHGGLLDRIDSLTAAAPIFAFGAMLLGIYLQA